MTTKEKQVPFLHPYNYKAFNSWSNFFRARSIALIDSSFSVIVFLKEFLSFNAVFGFFAVTISSLSAFLYFDFGILPFCRFLRVNDSHISFWHSCNSGKAFFLFCTHAIGLCNLIIDHMRFFDLPMTFASCFQ